MNSQTVPVGSDEREHRDRGHNHRGDAGERGALHDLHRVDTGDAGKNDDAARDWRHRAADTGRDLGDRAKLHDRHSKVRGVRRDRFVKSERRGVPGPRDDSHEAVSYTHLTLPTT